MIQKLYLQSSSSSLLLLFVVINIWPHFVLPFERDIRISTRCHRRAASGCVALPAEHRCLDTILPYQFTSIDNDADEDHHRSLMEVEQYLQRWRGLRSLPQCWRAAQPAICSSLLPRCDRNSSRTLRPPIEMCASLRAPCRFVADHARFDRSIEDVLGCHHHHRKHANQDANGANDNSRFGYGCPDVYSELRFVPSSAPANQSECPAPLVATDHVAVWHPLIEGCAYRCLPHPLYGDAHQRQLMPAIQVASIIALVLTTFCVATFRLPISIAQNERSRRKSANAQYPTIMIAHINACLAASYCAWWIPAIAGRSAVLCDAQDNIARRGMQQSSSAWCLLSFTIKYFFTIAAMVWFVLFAYGCVELFHDRQRESLQFGATAKKSAESGSKSGHRKRSTQSRLAARAMLFHMIAWIIPFVLTFAVWLSGEIEADTAFGVCSIGLNDTGFAAIFWQFPLTAGLTIGIGALCRTFAKLRHIRVLLLKEANYERRAAKCAQINHILFRIALTIAMIIIGAGVSFIATAQQYHLEDRYRAEIDNYIACSLQLDSVLSSANMSNHNSQTIPQFAEKDCDKLLTQHKNLAPLFAQLTVQFGTSIVASMWIFTKNTCKKWKCFLSQVKIYLLVWRKGQAPPPPPPAAPSSNTSGETSNQPDENDAKEGDNDCGDDDGDDDDESRYHAHYCGHRGQRPQKQQQQTPRRSSSLSSLSSVASSNGKTKRQLKVKLHRSSPSAYDLAELDLTTTSTATTASYSRILNARDKFCLCANQITAIETDHNRCRKQFANNGKSNRYMINNSNSSSNNNHNHINHNNNNDTSTDIPVLPAQESLPASGNETNGGSHQHQQRQQRRITRQQRNNNINNRDRAAGSRAPQQFVVRRASVSSSASLVSVPFVVVTDHQQQQPLDSKSTSTGDLGPQTQPQPQPPIQPDDQGHNQQPNTTNHHIAATTTISDAGFLPPLLSPPLSSGESNLAVLPASTSLSSSSTFGLQPFNPYLRFAPPLSNYFTNSNNNNNCQQANQSFAFTHGMADQFCKANNLANDRSITNGRPNSRQVVANEKVLKSDFIVPNSILSSNQVLMQREAPIMSPSLLPNHYNHHHNAILFNNCYQRTPMFDVYYQHHHHHHQQQQHANQVTIMHQQQQQIAMILQQQSQQKTLTTASNQTMPR